MTISTRAIAALLALLASLWTTPGALAQDNSQQLLEDFIHYTMIARPDLAAASVQQLMDSGISDAELAELIDGPSLDIDRLETALSRAQFVEELNDLSTDLAARIEAGRLELARDNARIAEAIQMLDGHLRARRLAEGRLKAAGEYAVPQLLKELVDGRDERLNLRVRRVLEGIGREAVYPLSQALGELGDPRAQRTVCEILGQIGYPHAQPALRELMDNPETSDSVRDAARQAYSKCGGVDTDLATLYATLGRQYFGETESLIASPYESTNNIWSYDAFAGLLPMGVPTEVFSEIRAMQMASRALGHDPDHQDALSLYVASNLRRENQLPAEATDPIYGSADYTPLFYATVFGTQTAFDVLGMALDVEDTALVRDALAALAKTTGGSNLFTAGSRQPLLETLSYPDRRVRYDAALIIGGSLPQQAFTGDFTVVPVLASAVRSGNRSYALVIAPSQEERRVLSNELESIGFEIVGAGESLSAVRGDIDAAIGVDLVVARVGSQDDATTVHESINRISRTSVAPLLVLADAADVPVIRLAFRGHDGVVVSRPGLTTAELEAVIEALMQAGAGGRMSEAEAEIYAIRALATLRDIAVSNNSVLDVADAQTALLDALQTRSGGTRDEVAKILAYIKTAEAQQALFDAAFTSSDAGEQADLLHQAANSVKRNGNLAEQRHIDALLDIIESSSGELAEAAAAVHGAMNLPASSAVDLIR